MDSRDRRVGPAPPRSDPLVAVLDVLRLGGPMTRGDLVAHTGLSRSTVSALLGGLRRQGLLDDVEHPGVRTGGRPAAPLALLPSAGLAVGVDVGRTHVRVVAVGAGHQVLAERERALEVDGHFAEAMDVAVELVDAVLVDCGACRDDVLGVGLGVPAPLDGRGQVGSSSMLPGWVGETPSTALGDRLGLAVVTENDANLGALAEALWGAGRTDRVVVHVKASTGIGAGIVLDGQLFRGATGTAGELGHTTVREGGAVCRCGNRGCLELSAGGPALLAQVRSTGAEVTSLPQLVALAQDGDAGSRRVLDDAGDQLGVSLANLVNLLNPDVILVGGELSRAGDLVLGPLRARVARSALPPSSAAVRVRLAELGNRAEALGGALLVLRELERFDAARFYARCRLEVEAAPLSG